MTVWYNEPDRHKAAWLRHLIEERAIAHGIVDERPIQAVQAEDLRGFAQCHFFAGVGVWSYACRLAGWPDDRPIWTGSCPCGPFSKAGLRKGFEDPRHLWPQWFRLIGIGRPVVLFGEQSDEADAWLDLVSSDLENRSYAVGSAIIPAAGFGGAHERHRIGFVADADNAEWWAERAPWNDGGWPKTGRVQGDRDAGERGDVSRMADAQGVGWGQEHPNDRRGIGRSRAQGVRAGFATSSNAQRLGDSNRYGQGPRRGDIGEVREFQEAKCQSEFGPAVSGRGSTLSLSRLSDAKLGIIRRSGWRPEGRAAEQPGDPSGPGVDWLFCRDSRCRPVESGTCPLVDASPARMGRLRGYGDAIDAEAFANFIGAYMDAAPGGAT